MTDSQALAIHAVEQASCDFVVVSVTDKKILDGVHHKN